jgi:hypothetical protein
MSAGTIVEYTGLVGIRVSYLGPTNTKGSRWRVHRADGKYGEDPDRLTVPFGHGLSVGDQVAAAVKEYLDRKAKRHAAESEGGEGWPGRWVLAAAGLDEYIATWVERTQQP